ncbi:MAG: hypothetical protein HRU19_17980 [Pseudobacteriovorax sp.]|nr:hypothetical protein [Pseudobacteriovorax sp.]
MGDFASTDYETYREIMGELLKPINQSGLDSDTLKRLYESKAVYLENLRIKCFMELNNEKSSFFTWQDYDLILQALSENKKHIRSLILLLFDDQLSHKSVS